MCTAFCVYRLACGPSNDMTPAVATDHLLCVPPCVRTAFYVYRLACGPLHNMTAAAASDCNAYSCIVDHGRPKVRQAAKSAEPIGQLNPSPVKSGGPVSASHFHLFWPFWCIYNNWANKAKFTYPMDHLALVLQAVVPNELCCRKSSRRRYKLNPAYYVHL